MWKEQTWIIFIELKLDHWLGKTETHQSSLAESKDCFLHLTYLLKYMDSQSQSQFFRRTTNLQKEDYDFVFHFPEC